MAKCLKKKTRKEQICHFSPPPKTEIVFYAWPQDGTNLYISNPGTANLVYQSYKMFPK